MKKSPFKIEYIPCSFIGNIIVEFVEQKRAESLSYTAEYQALKSFDRYLIENNISQLNQITQNLIDDWQLHRSHAIEPKDYRYAVRDLFIYMKFTLGLDVIIPPRSYRIYPKQPHIFRSPMKDHLAAFIQFKHSNGYKYESEEGILLLFDRLCQEMDATSVTKELVLAWCKQRDCESYIYASKRISIIRQFAEFLIAQGYKAFRAPEYPHPKVIPPHIFSEEEIKAILHEADIYNYKKWALKISLPVLLRFYYGMGLRLDETLNLSYEDVDLITGCVHIKAAKNQKDRDVYMSNDLLHIAKLYDKTIKSRLISRQLFFVNDLAGSKILNTTVCRIFNTLWKRTGYDRLQDKKPTIHSFRHTFVVRKMEEWYREKVDFAYYMPYLSAFLGHHSLKETYYYVHFVDSSFPDIRNAMSDFEHLYPEVRS